MATTELTERDITKKMLEDAADDMSAVMKFEDAIPTGKKIVKAAIQADVVEAAGELRVEDVLKPKTVEVLTALGVNLPASDQGEESKANAVTETVPEPKTKEPITETKKEPSTEEKSEGKDERKPSKIGQTRTGSFVDVINELKDPITIERLAELVNDNYVANGGKSNVGQSLHLTKIIMPCAIGFGKVEVIDGQITSLR